MTGNTPSRSGNPGELYRAFREGGGSYEDFALPAGMANTGAIIARAVKSTTDGGKPRVEFRYTAPTGMTDSRDSLSAHEIGRRVQMTASILDAQQQAQ